MPWYDPRTWGKSNKPTGPTGVKIHDAKTSAKLLAEAAKEAEKERKQAEKEAKARGEKPIGPRVQTVYRDMVELDRPAGQGSPVGGGFEPVAREPDGREETRHIAGADIHVFIRKDGFIEVLGKKKLQQALKDIGKGKMKPVGPSQLMTVPLTSHEHDEWKPHIASAYGVAHEKIIPGSPHRLR